MTSKPLSSYNCDPESDGKPRCRLAVISDPRGYKYAHTVQVKGASGTEISRKARDNIEREYDVVIVGEAPGAQEDKSGIPFVGDAGDILVDFLDRAGFDLDRVYITNAVKCRPPKNRNPSTEELKQCFIHIDHEIRTIKPKVVILTGRIPLRLFKISDSITNIHGKLYQKKLPGWEDGPDFLIVPTFHPAMFLHRPNPQLKVRATDDYIFAKNLLEGGAEAKRFYRCEYKLCDTVSKVRKAVKKIKEKNVFSFDTESCSLGIEQNPMIMVQLSQGEGKTWVIPFYRHDPEGLDWKLKPQWNNEEREEVINLLKELFEDEKIQQIAHNIKYDVNVIAYHLGIETKGFLWDTSLIYHLLDARLARSLEFLGDLEFATGNWEEEVAGVVGRGREKNHTYDHIPDSIFHQYAATDAEITFRLFKLVLPRLTQKKRLFNLYAKHVHPLIRTLAKAEQAGNYINLDALNLLAKDCDERIEKLIRECRELTKPDFNPGSHQQVRDAFLNLGMGESIVATHKATGYSTDKTTLSELDHPLAKAVLDYRKVSKLKTTYVDRALADIGPDNRIRYSFNIGGTVSGRLSARFLHQIERIDKEKLKEGRIVLRDIFGEEDDFYYFYADYSQIELRIFAVLTGEKALLDLLADPDADFHSLTAAGALGVQESDVSDFNRSNVGKRLNFGIIYGSEGYSISKGTYETPDKQIRVIGLARAQGMVRSLHQRFPKIKEYLEDVIIQANARGNKLSSVFGRELSFPEMSSESEYTRKESERQAVNFTVQSPAGDITNQTMYLVDQKLEEEGIGMDKIRLLNTVHDSISYGVHKDHLEWFYPTFKSIAERPIPELNDYSFLVKCGWSMNSWREAELQA